MRSNPSRMSAAQIAEVAGVGVATVRRWAACGNFPKPIVLGPRSQYWPRADVDAWLSARGASGRVAAQEVV